MKRILPYILLVLIGMLMASSSCEKQVTFPKDSIYGPWRCFQDDSFSPYDISINFEGSDSTLISIRNFHNLGFSVEAFGIVSDTIIEIMYSEPFHDLSGTGRIKRDFSAIYWEYNFSGNLFYSVFLRP